MEEFSASKISSRQNVRTPGKILMKLTSFGHKNILSNRVPGGVAEGVLVGVPVVDATYRQSEPTGTYDNFEH
jgi:hypothetical protein